MALETFDYPDGATSIAGATTQSGAYVINSGELTATQNETVVTWPSQYNGRGEFTFNAAGTQNGYIRYVFRYQDSNNYLAVLFRTSDKDLKLFQFVGGVSQLLSSVNIGGGLSDTRTIGVSFFGDIISMSLNGQEVKSIKDESGVTGTQSGFRIDNPNSYFIHELSYQDATPVIPTSAPRVEHTFSAKARSITKIGKILDTHSVMVANGDTKELWPYVISTENIPNWPHARFPLLMVTSSDHGGGDGGIYARVFDTQAGPIGSYGSFVEWQTVSNLPEFNHISQKNGRIYRDIENGTQTETPTLHVENGQVIMTYQNSAVFVSASGGNMQNTCRAISTNGIDFVRDTSSPILRYDQRFDNGDGHTGYFSDTFNIIDNDGSYLGTSAHGGGGIALGPTQAVWHSLDRVTWSIRHRFGRLQGEILDFAPDWAAVDWIYTLGSDISTMRKEGEFYRVIFKVRPDVVVGGVNDNTTMCEILVDENFCPVSAPNYFLPLGSDGAFDDYANIDYSEFEYDGKTYGVHLANDANDASSIGLVEVNHIDYDWNVYRPLSSKNTLQYYGTSGLTNNTTTSVVNGEVQMQVPAGGGIATASGVAVTPSSYEVLDLHIGAIAKNADVNVSGRFGFYDSPSNPQNGVGLYWHSSADTAVGEDRYFLSLELIENGNSIKKPIRKALGQILADSPSLRESPTARLDVGIRIVPAERKIFVIDGVSPISNDSVGAVDLTVALTPAIAFSTTEVADETIYYKDLSVISASNDLPVVSDTTAPVVTNNGPATLTITVGDTYTPDFSTNEGTLNIDNPVDIGTAGTYTVTATATDAAGNVGSETQTVIVEAAQQVNQPPTANAGPNQSVAAGVEFVLDGTGSQDTDGNIVEWRWTQTAGDPVILDTSTPSQPKATSPSRTSAQTLTFQLITVDNEGEESSPGIVNVNVAAVVLSEILKVIERLDFDLVTQGDVNAYFGRANREVMKLKPSDPTGLALDANGFMMLDSNTIQEIKVIADGNSISSSTDSINIEGSEMLVRLGDLEASKNGNIYFSIVVFVEGDTKGVVVSSKGSSGNKPMSYVTL